MLEAVADKLHDFNLFQLFFSQSGYRDFSVINIVGVAGRYGQVMLVSLSFSTRGFVKLFEGKSLQRFDSKENVPLSLSIYIGINLKI